MAQEWGADAAFDMYRGSLVAYSALRDPVDGFVRVFLDAEPFLAKALTCHFQARCGLLGALVPWMMIFTPFMTRDSIKSSSKAWAG